MAVELGAFFAARPAVGNLHATLGALAIGAAWVAVTCPALAAGGKNWLAAMLRGGIVADASALSLLVIWLVSPCVTLLAAIEIYAIYAASALLGIAVVSCARTPAGRYAAAAIAAAAVMLTLATPFWMGGILKAAGQGTRPAIAAAAVRVNPFYSITAAVFDNTSFAWNEAKIMYGKIQQIQDYASAAPRWYSAAAVHGAAAAMLAAICLIFKRASDVSPARPVAKGSRPAAP